MMDIQDVYRKKLAAQLKEWNAQIDLWEARAENAGADLKLKRAEMLHGLRAKQHAASETLKDLEKAGGEAWEQVRVTTEKIWEDLKTGIAEAHSKFK
jgi:recombinational DNA repair ATPase RecF